MTKKNSGVYQIYCHGNGRRYIGSSINLKTRLNYHRSTLRNGTHYNEHLLRAFEKYGEDAFEFTVLEYADPDRVLEIEQNYIDLVGPEFNIVAEAASTRGYKHTKETRKRLSEIQRGRPHKTAAQKRADRLHAERMSGEGNSRFGKKVSKQTRAKIAEAHTGKTLTEEHKRAISNGVRGKQNKPVAKIDLDSGEVLAIYASGKDAAINENGSRGLISQVCNGKRRSHKGFGWIFT